MDNLEYSNEDVKDLPKEFTEAEKVKRWRTFTKDHMYLISEAGDIWSYHKSRLLISKPSESYIKINILKHIYPLHRLVYFSFRKLDDPELIDGLVIDHIDRNKLNNSISNLRLVNKSVNSSNKDPGKTKEYVRIDPISKEEVIFKSQKDAINNTPKATSSGITKACTGVYATHAGYAWKTESYYNIVIPDENEIYINLGIIEGVDYSNYEINKHGVVRKIIGDKRIILKQYIRTGYLCVSLNNGAERRGFKVHRLVAYKCCSNWSEERNIVNHKDMNKLNNNADNLEWVTKRENNIHGMGKKVKSTDISDNTVKYYNSISEAADDIILTQNVGSGVLGSISGVCRGVHKVAYGRYWEFVIE